MNVIARRVGLLILGILGLWALLSLHGLERRQSDPKVDITKVKLGASGAYDAPPTLIDAALKRLRDRGQYKFATRDELILAIDSALAVPMPIPERGTVADAATNAFKDMVVASAELKQLENQFRGRLPNEPLHAYSPANEYKSPEAKLNRLTERRQQLNLIYLSRAMALDSYDKAVRQSVRRYLETLPDKRIGVIEVTPENQFLAKLVDRKHPQHVIFDLLWYAALILAVIAFTAFIATGLFAVFGLPGLREAFGNQTTKLIDANGRSGGGIARAGTLASAGALALVGLGAAAGTIGGASSSPWQHADLLTRRPDHQQSIPGAAGAAGAPGAPGTTATAGTGELLIGLGLQGDPGADGKDGVLTHRVEVAPVKLDPSQIVLNPEFRVPPAPVPEVVATMPAPPGWPERFVQINEKLRTLDGQIRNEVTTEVAKQVEPRLAPVEDKVQTLDDAREAELASATTVDVAGQWAWLPWHREFHVGSHEIALIARATSDLDRANVVAALKMLEGQRLRYFSFVSAFRSAMTTVMATESFSSRQVDAAVERNISKVLSVCRVRR